MYKRKQRGFSLIEILIATAIMVVGLLGVLALLRAGIHSTKEAIEDSNAAIIAESAISSLQASLQQLPPTQGSQLEFFHDGISINANKFDRPTTGESLYIPGGIGAPNTPTEFCRVGEGVNGSTPSDFPFNTTIANDDPKILRQYDFNIEITPATEANDLFDVIIRIRRQNRQIRQFRTQVIIPPILE